MATGSKAQICIARSYTGRETQVNIKSIVQSSIYKSELRDTVYLSVILSA